MSENDKNIIKTQINEKSTGENQDNEVLEIRKKGRPRNSPEQYFRSYTI